MIEYNVGYPTIRGWFNAGRSNALAQELGGEFGRVHYDTHPLNNGHRTMQLLGDIGMTHRVKRDFTLAKDIRVESTEMQIAVNNDWHMDGLRHDENSRLLPPKRRYAGASYGGQQCVVGSVPFPIDNRPMDHDDNQIACFLEKDPEQGSAIINHAIDSGDAAIVDCVPGALTAIGRRIHRATPLELIEAPAPDYRMLVQATPWELDISFRG